MKFALVAVPFLFLLIAAMDLGRYFITQHSLRTLAARSAVVKCFGLGAWPFATAVPSPQQVWANVPFLNSSLQRVPVGWPRVPGTAARSAAV